MNTNCNQDRPSPLVRQTKRVLFTVLAVAALVTGATTAEETGTLETATFSMYCYWTGEATLGLVDGVEASRIGHWGGKEIVQVDYNPGRTNLPELVAALKQQRSFYSVVVSTPSAARATAAQVTEASIDTLSGKPHFIEPKHSLRTVHPNLAAMDLTEAQAIALNSWSYFGGGMPQVLSPEQMAKLRELEKR